MKRNIFLLLFFLPAWYPMLWAQSQEFLPGYFILPAGDTIRGYIQDRSRISQSEVFYFKTGFEQAEPTSYSPEQVAQYFYEPSFIFRAMPIVRSGKQERKFLRQLVSGYAALFEYANTEAPLYVLTKASGESVQLEKRDSMIAGRLKEDHRYLGIMMSLFQDCRQFLTRTNRIDFTQNMLARFVYQYNRCAHPETESRTMTVVRKLRVDLGPTAGLSFANISTNSYNGSYNTGQGDGSGFQAGLLLHFSYFDKLALRSGLIYHSYDLVSQEAYSLGSDQYRHIFKTLEIPLNLRYRITSQKISPYLYGGIILPLYLEKTLNTQRNQLGEVISDTDSEIDMSGGALMLNGGLGASCKLSQNTQVQLNLEYRRLHVEFTGNRIFDSNMLACSVDLLF